MTTAKPISAAPTAPASRRGRAVLGPLGVVLGLGTVLGVVAALVAGSPGLLGVVTGTVLVAAVFAFGAVVLGAVALVAPAASLLVALLTYTLQVVLVGVFYVVVRAEGLLDGAIDARWLSAAVIAATLAWTTTQIVVVARSRQLAYELPEQGAEASVR